MSSKISGMRSGTGRTRKTAVRRVVRRSSYSRRGNGNWNLFGLIHGGKEGKQWQKAKDLVLAAQNQCQKAVTEIKASYIVGIWKKSKLSSDDKNKLISQIRAMTFK